jgi:hypothetical protein
MAGADEPLELAEHWITESFGAPDDVRPAEAAAVEKALSAGAFRVERRLTQELTGLRTEIARSQARLRVGLRHEVHESLTAFRAELGVWRIEHLRWALALWVAQFVATAALLSFVLGGR